MQWLCSKQKWKKRKKERKRRFTLKVKWLCWVSGWLQITIWLRSRFKVSSSKCHNRAPPVLGGIFFSFFLKQTQHTVGKIIIKKNWYSKKYGQNRKQERFFFWWETRNGAQTSDIRHLTSTKTPANTTTCYQNTVRMFYQTKATVVCCVVWETIYTLLVLNNYPSCYFVFSSLSSLQCWTRFVVFFSVFHLEKKHRHFLLLLCLHFILGLQFFLDYSKDLFREVVRVLFRN